MKKIVLALSLCASSALLANESNYEWEFTPTIGGTVYEGNMDLDGAFTFGARLAKNLPENWWLDQVEFGYDYQDSVGLRKKAKRVPGASKPSVNSYYINLVKNLVNFTDNFKLYGLVGMGYMDYSAKVDHQNYDNGFGQYGAGLKYYWTDNFATKLEVRDTISFHKGDNVMFYSLGFAADIGKRYEEPAPAPAPVIGDEDGDGVPDNLDKCPGTPAGVVVDANGCEKIIRLELGVNFAFNSAELKPTGIQKVKEIAQFLSEHPDYSVVLDGYTDSTGSEAYNMKLSQRRAQSVANALMQLGVPASKITTHGYGEADPIASNDTPEGRAQNRRVDAKFRK